MMSVEMFAMELDNLLESRKGLSKQQECISCECVDAEADIICHDVQMLKAFADLKNLEIRACEGEVHPLEDTTHCYVVYKDVRIVTYLDQKEYEAWIIEKPSPEAMEQRIKAYASKMAC